MPSERRAYAAMTHHMHTIPIPKDQHTLPTRGRHSALRASLAPRETGPPGSFRLGWVARPTVGIGWNSEGEESKCTDSWWARLQASQALPPARSSFRLSFRSRPAARAAPPRGPPRSADAPHPPGPARALLPAPRCRPRTGRKAGIAHVASHGRSARWPWSRVTARDSGSLQRSYAPPAYVCERLSSSPWPLPRQHGRRSPPASPASPSHPGGYVDHQRLPKDVGRQLSER